MKLASVTTIALSPTPTVGDIRMMPGLLVEVEDPLGLGQVRMNQGAGSHVDDLTRVVTHQRQPVGQGIEPFVKRCPYTTRHRARA